MGVAWAMKTLARRFGYTAASIVRYRDRIRQQLKAAIAPRRSSQRKPTSTGCASRRAQALRQSGTSVTVSCFAERPDRSRERMILKINRNQ